MNIKKSKIKQTRQKPNVIGYVPLAKAAWLDISSFWRSLGTILIVYAVFNLLFVASISLLPSNQALQDELTNYIGGSAGRVLDSIVLVSISVINISSPGNTLLQVLLIIVTSMAFVWALRKLRGLQKISVRQAYYEGPSNIIPVLFTCLLLLLTVLPASLGSTLLLYALPIVGTTVELIVVYSISGGLMALSLYWLMVWWPAIYISMLPAATPFASMRAAAILTKRNRLRILQRFIVIFFVFIVTFLCIVIPIALIWQRLVPMTVYIVLIVLFGVWHVVSFNIYRSLVDESTEKK